MSDKELFHEIEHDVQSRYESGTPYSSGDFEGMTDQEHGLVLHHSAMLQRKRPEDAMLAIQNKLGDGLYPHTVEHVGDIYHRAQERGGVYGLEYVLPKVRLMKSELEDPRFSATAQAHVKSNSQYNKDPSIHWDAAVALGKDYATEHSRLPIYNHPAFLANQAAQHLGNMRFGAASESLNQLFSHMDGPTRDFWEDPTPKQKKKHSEAWGKIHDNWHGLHSRQSSIDFLKSIGR